MGIFNKIKPTTWIYLCLAIIVCVFVVNYLEIFDFKPDLNGDNVYYYALGRAIAAGKGYTNIMFLEETPHSHFPPGYPLFNAGILLFTHSYTALKIANGILFGLSILILFFLLKRISGNLFVALSTCLLCCMQQALLRYSTIVMSEMLFTFLTLGVLYLISLIDMNHLFCKKLPPFPDHLFHSDDYRAELHLFCPDHGNIHHSGNNDLPRYSLCPKRSHAPQK